MIKVDLSLETIKNHEQNCKKKIVKRQGLRIVHPYAAGINVGSRKHYVAIPAKCGNETVRYFGCMTPDLHEMAKWLKQNRVDTVAMESTGVYLIENPPVRWYNDVQLLTVR